MVLNIFVPLRLYSHFVTWARSNLHFSFAFNRLLSMGTSKLEVLKAQRKMPCGHGRTGSNIENVAYRRSRTLFRRSSDENNHNFSPKESQISALVLRNSEERYFIFTLVALELDTYWKLATFLPRIHGSDQRNHLGSGAHCTVNGLESISPPAIICHVSLQTEHNGSSSGAHFLGQSYNRNKQNNSFKSLDNSSGLLCDSLGADGSDVLINDVHKVDKPVKKSSRKKGKKKGKQYKRSVAKKVPIELESQWEDSSRSASILDASSNCGPACFGERISEEKLPEKATSCSLSVKDNTIVKEDSQTNDGYIDSSTTLLSRTSGMGESELNRTSTTAQFPEKNLLNVDVNVRNSHYEQKSNCNSETYSDDIENTLSIKDEGTIDYSGDISETRNDDSSLRRTAANSCAVENKMSSDCYMTDTYWSKDIAVHCPTERAQCSGQVSSSNDFHPVLSGKRGRLTRKMTSHTGKDNHSVWQRVKKMDSETCVYEMKNGNLVSAQVDFSTDSQTRVTGPQQHQRGKTSRDPSSCEMLSQTKPDPFKIVGDSSEINVKPKPSSVSKQANRYSSKGSHNGNINVPRQSKIRLPQKEGVKTLPQVNHKKHIRTGLRSSSSTDSRPLVAMPAEKLDFYHAELQQKSREHMEKAIPSGDIYSTVYVMSSTAGCNQMGLKLTVESLDQAHIRVHSNSSNADCYKDVNEYHSLMGGEDDRCRKSQTESSHGECSKTSNSVGPVVQKWVRVGEKDSRVSNMSHTDNLMPSVVDESVPNRLHVKNAEGEVSSDAYCFLSLGGGREGGLRYNTEDMDCSSPETDKLTIKLKSHPHTAREFIGVPAVSNCHLIDDVNDQAFSGLETDLNKIVQAVDDAYKLQMVAEDIQLVTGSPLADFERFICAASPVIGLRYHSRSCKTCSLGQLTSNSLCLHQIPNISLGNLWQWYEEPGCYGLKVKAEDHHNSRRLQNGSEFSAYFVPYLSAVQLFGRCGTSNSSSNGEAMVSGEVDTATKYSPDLGSLPIFSMLLPRPLKEVDGCLLELSSAKDEFCSQPVTDINLGDEELIFEYFERDQPSHRRPLFEKIKELARGETSSNNQRCGDPLKLESVNVHDLHPASWYSVAWYPIYRIPEANFHAAFLTYHSLGHFVHQSGSSNVACDSSHLVCPVVGLQSYNAKRDCWFQLRGSKSKVVQPEVPLCPNPSETLEEWLRKLEHTASVMATASVRKDNKKSVNSHPDFNYFFSRW